jgi:hypothetical protein
MYKEKVVLEIGAVDAFFSDKCVRGQRHFNVVGLHEVKQ